MKKTPQEIRESMLEKAERINAYNKYVEDTAVRTENTVSKFWAKDVSVNIKLDTTLIAFGTDGIAIHNSASIESGIERLDKFIAELQQAREELITVKDDGGLNNGRI